MQSAEVLHWAGQSSSGSCSSSEPRTRLLVPDKPVEVIFIETSVHLPGASLRRCSEAVGEEGCGGSRAQREAGGCASVRRLRICHLVAAPASSSPCRSEIVNVSVVGSSLYCVGRQPPFMSHQRPLNHSVRTVAVTDISPPHTIPEDTKVKPRPARKISPETSTPIM